MYPETSVLDTVQWEVTGQDTVAGHVLWHMTQSNRTWQVRWDSTQTLWEWVARDSIVTPWFDFTTAVGDTFVSWKPDSTVGHYGVAAPLRSVETSARVFDACFGVGIDYPMFMHDKTAYWFADSIGIVMIAQRTETRRLLAARINGRQVSIESDPRDMLPKHPTLDCYPNPSNQRMTIRFTLPSQQRIRVLVYSVSGHLVTTVTHQSWEAGAHEVTWPAAQSASGVYFIVLQTSEQVLSHKAILLK
ncbi:MAG: T9SS type A sorting domain-containing protein [Candidatus Marinimicrobia bacterium]|nr:T9SS type A sorting domain-containing protein [Candidatus Neomarinimicrobiota bacterium]MCF7828725.1 T9SS type A sorting domain-containing protein [Candidatus Neomarinimicrobiota bacterium]MCF7880466.1 T9SS type A sorting domain-containing protein [Candidatus Neomarinimicrobiota bacterium]